MTLTVKLLFLQFSIILSLLGYIWREQRKQVNGVGEKVRKIIAFMSERAENEKERERITNLFFK